MNVGYVNDQGQLVHEFVFYTTSARCKTAKVVHHTACNAVTHPDITVYNPDDISFCFSISPAHIPNLGVWP